MDTKAEIIKWYFKLSDLASDDSQALSAIIGLFSKEAVIKSANGLTVETPIGIAHFFENFFKDNQELRHLCHVVATKDGYQAEWAVAGCKQTGQLFAFHGTDTYTFDQNNKITFLQVAIHP
ncbi:nuclear transport factor 2 family protein [Levilactobacillus yonginensis]|uniref:nuclear transport factor 2 family protein n=1 Tax=Levilactobacillus yonginensis TaxID=1054041 RepID=UPI00345CF66F